MRAAVAVAEEAADLRLDAVLVGQPHPGVVGVEAFVDLAESALDRGHHSVGEITRQKALATEEPRPVLVSRRRVELLLVAVAALDRHQLGERVPGGDVVDHVG